MCSERTAGCRRRKLSNAVWRSNEKTLSHSTILLLFKTGEESGLLKPAPAAHQLWFWKTEPLSKIFVLADVISELPSAPGAIRSTYREPPFPKGDLPAAREGRPLGSRSLLPQWVSPALLVLLTWGRAGAAGGVPGCRRSWGPSTPRPAPCLPADIPDNKRRTPPRKPTKSSVLFVFSLQYLTLLLD